MRSDALVPSRSLSYAVAIALGLAIGLLAYRFVAKPFVWSGGNTLSVVGFALLASAWETRRRYPWVTSTVSRGKMVASVCAAALVASAGAFQLFPTLGFLKLAPRSLPGFDLALPRGDQEVTNLNYAMGRFDVQRLGGITAGILVSWQPGDAVATEDESVLLFGQAIAAGAHSAITVRPFPVTVVVPEAPQARSWTMGIDASKMVLTFLRCGGRTIYFITFADDAGVGRLHQRIAATFHCRPDPASEGTLVDSPVIFDLPSGWTRVKGDPGALRLVSEHGSIVVQTLQETTTPEALVESLPAIPKIRLGQRFGDSWEIETGPPGQSAGLLRILSCPERHLNIMLMWNSSTLESNREVGLESLRSGRCRRADEPPQEWATVQR